MDELDILKILNKVKTLKALKSDKELAELIGMKTGNFSAKKKTGTVLYDVFFWALKEDISLDWLFKDKPQKDYCEALEDISEWIYELARHDPDFQSWFKVELKKKFPDYAEWLKRKEKNPGQDNTPPFLQVSNNK